jgi:serine/threonine protein kinase
LRFDTTVSWSSLESYEGMAGSSTDLLQLDEDLLQWDIKGGLRVPLGKPGSYGAVYKAKYAGEAVAVKQVDISLSGSTLGQQEERFLREVRIHHKLRHKHAVALLGALIIQDDPESDKSYYIVMEKLRGSLNSLVLREDGLLHGAHVKERIRWLHECAQAIRFMHEQHIIHADIKPENILLDFDGTDVSEVHTATAKIADFGLSRVQHKGTLVARSTAKGKQGSPLYMDPALFDDITAISRSSDIYSFGILAWQLITGETPFEDVLESVGTLSGFEAAVRDGTRPPVSALDFLLPAAAARDVASLLEECWDGERERRPKARQVEERLQGVLDSWSESPYAACDFSFSEDSPRSTAGAGTRRAVRRRSGMLHPFTGALDIELEGHSTSVTALGILPDGRLVSGCAEGYIKIWNADTGTCEEAFSAHTNEVRGFIVLSEKQLISYSSDGTVVAWDITTWSSETIRTGLDSIKSVVALPSGVSGGVSGGGFAACSYFEYKDDRNNSIHVWKDSAAPCTLFKGHTDMVECLLVLPDGRLVSGSHDCNIRVWNISTGECLQAIPAIKMNVRRIVLLTDGTIAACGPFGSKIQVFNLTTGKCNRTIVVEATLSSLLALPSGQVACGTSDGRILVWNAATGTCDVTVESRSTYVLALVAFPDGKLASGSEEGRIMVWC